MHGPRELAAAFTTLAATDDVTYVVASDFKIIRKNRAWDRFARENGGDVADRGYGSLLAAIPGPLKQFFLDGFARATRDDSRWEHDYECSSAEVLRRYRMIAYPFSGWFLITHSLLVARPHDQSAARPDDHHVKSGIITMCAHCRRVRRWSEPEAWDWIPAYVTLMPPHVSHGLCGACVAYYYDAA